MRSGRRPGAGILAALALTLLSAPPLRGQEVAAAFGAGSADVVPDGRTDAALELDMSSAGDLAVGTLEVDLAWDPDRLSVSATAADVAGGTVSVRGRGDGDGKLTVLLESTGGIGSTVELATVTLGASSTAGATTLGVAVRAAETPSGSDLTGSAGERPLEVCVGTLGPRGDVSGDGSVNVLDAQQIARFSAGLSVPDEERLQAVGDADGDGGVDIVDAQQVARFSAGLSAADGIGEGVPGGCGNRPPTAAISAPADDGSFEPGTSLTLEGSAVDPEDGPLSGERLVWRSDVDGDLGNGTTVSVSLSDAAHTVSLTAGDADGATARAAVDVSVGQPNLAVGSFQFTPRGVLESETTSLHATIRNTGSGDAPGAAWSLRVDGAEVAAGQVGPVAPGEAVEIDPPTVGPFADGTHTGRLVLDPDDAVAETEESDNEATGRLVAHPPGFDIELQFLDSADELSAGQRDVVREAADRWASIITGDVLDIAASADDPLDVDDVCFDGESSASPRTADVDDAVVYIRTDSIDGEGSTAASGGSCFIRVGDPFQPPFTIVGFVVFEPVDADDLEDRGLFRDLALHELGHAMGVGIWELGRNDEWDLRVGTGTADPTYTGRGAIEAFLAAGGDAFDGEPVPVEGVAGEGSRDVHWRESVLGTELMTPFLNSGDNPLSAVTVRSLADQYYAVDRSEADAFQLDLGGGGLGPAAAGLRLGDHVAAPRRGIDVHTGEVRTLRRLRPGGEPE